LGDLTCGFFGLFGCIVLGQFRICRRAEEGCHWGSTVVRRPASSRSSSLIPGHPARISDVRRLPVGLHSARWPRRSPAPHPLARTFHVLAKTGRPPRTPLSSSSRIHLASAARSLSQVLHPAAGNSHFPLLAVGGSRCAASTVAPRGLPRRPRQAPRKATDRSRAPIQQCWKQPEHQRRERLRPRRPSRCRTKQLPSFDRRRRRADPHTAAGDQNARS